MAQNENQRLKTPPPDVNARSGIPDNGTDLDAPTDINLQASAPAVKAGEDATMMDHATASRVANRSAMPEKDAAEATRLDGQNPSSMGSQHDAKTVVMHASGMSGATKPTSAQIAPAPKSSQDELVGREMGPARLEKKLGQGGMGMVYLGHHMSLDKKVAVKILPKSLADKSQEYVERFRREAIAAGKLEHQNIVQVYDVNKSDEYYYIIMQFVEGCDLRDIVKKHVKLSVEQAVDYTLQIARGLSAANKQGIIHRDIKPENVLVGKDNVAKIADFGLAGLQDSNLTREGQAMGSPYYMSPEQCVGGDLDIRTDIYALGVTFYFLLTGTHPYTGQTPLEIMQKHSSADIPNVSKAVSDIPESVALVIRRMMMKERDDRYKDPDELIADLEALVQDPNAIPVGAMKARPPLVSTQAVLVLAAAIVIVALVYIFAGGDNGGKNGSTVIAQAAVPTISINGVVIPVEKGKGVVQDTWRSPMRVAMFETDIQSDAKFVKLQKGAIISGLSAGGIVPVERSDESFGKILTDLAISKTDLVDQDKKLAVGKLLNAHLMLKVNIATEGKDGMIAAECVDVATSKVLDSQTFTFATDDKGAIPQTTIKDVVAGIEKLLANQAIQGSVKEVGKDGKAVLDIGAFHGVKAGQVFAVVDDKNKDTERQLTVESVDELTCVAAEKTPGALKAGTHVRQIMTK